MPMVACMKVTMCVRDRNIQLLSVPSRPGCTNTVAFFKMNSPTLVGGGGEGRDLIRVVEFVVHKSCDDAGLANRLISQENLSNINHNRSFRDGARALNRMPGKIPNGLSESRYLRQVYWRTSLYLASGDTIDP